MSTSLLKTLSFVLFLGACATSSRHSTKNTSNPSPDTSKLDQPLILGDNKPLSLHDLAQTQDGGFVLAPGLYEASFKTYCLQPGTPDPRPQDAYLQGPVMGYRKEIIESILTNSRHKSDVDQRNIQLLLWSVVSGSDFDKLSYRVQADATRLLTPKQIFELRGGVLGAIKEISYASGILNANKDIQRLFEMGTSSYESFERLAVLQQPSQIRKTGVKYDQWYKQKENYYIRYFPESYKKVRMQVYVPDGLLDGEGKVGGEYVVFDPTGQQAIPAYTDAQRLGIGAPVLDIVKVIIQVHKKSGTVKKAPERKPEPEQRDKKY